MKKVTLITISLSILFTGTVFAQEIELPEAGLTPASPFYFLERITEAIGTFFTFGDLKKAERHVVLAAERLAEAKAVVEKGKPELVEKTLKRYENQLVKALLRAKKAKTKGKNTDEVTKTISESTQKHLTVLEEVLEKVPEEAKPAIRHAMIVSTKEGLETAVAEALLDQSLSPRALCKKEGGPSEVCEKLPQSVESFEALEAFCIEMGVSPEQCAETEAMCKEMGAITPDECSRGFFTIRSYVATPLSEKERCLREGGPPEMCEKLPSPVLPEEEIEKEKKGTIIPSPPPLPE